MILRICRRKGFLFTWTQVRAASDLHSSGTASVDFSKLPLAVLKLRNLLDMVAFVCSNIKQLYPVVFLFALQLHCQKIKPRLCKQRTICVL